jgi:hypothetical protein
VFHFLFNSQQYRGHNSVPSVIRLVNVRRSVFVRLIVNFKGAYFPFQDRTRLEWHLPRNTNANHQLRPAFAS